MVQGQASLQGYLRPLAAAHSAAMKLENCWKMEIEIPGHPRQKEVHWSKMNQAAQQTRKQFTMVTKLKTTNKSKVQS
jgi:hypothetical protein